MFLPQGAHNVRCARCSHITTVPSAAPPPPAPSNDMAQLACTNPHCRCQLMYPRGALQVQCSLCGTLNDAQQANQLGHVVCGGCQITLMYAFGAQSVKCAVCNHVTPAAPQQHSRPPPQYQQQQYQQPPQYHHHHQQQQQQPTGFNAPQQQQHGGAGAGAGPAASVGASSADGAKPVHAVLVENPPSLDESGNEVQNVAVLGLAPKQEPR